MVAHSAAAVGAGVVIVGIGPQNHQSRPSLLDPYLHFPPHRLSCLPGAPIVVPVASPSLSGGHKMLQLWELGIGTINRSPSAPIPIRNSHLSAIPPAMASCHRSRRFPVAFGRSANATNVGKHPVRLPVPPAVQLISVRSLVPLLLPIPYPPSSTAPSPYLYALSGDQFQLWPPKWPRSGPILLANEWILFTSNHSVGSALIFTS